MTSSVHIGFYEDERDLFDAVRECREREIRIEAVRAERALAQRVELLRGEARIFLRHGKAAVGVLMSSTADIGLRRRDHLVARGALQPRIDAVTGRARHIADDQALHAQHDLASGGGLGEFEHLGGDGRVRARRLRAVRQSE